MLHASLLLQQCPVVLGAADVDAWGALLQGLLCTWRMLSSHDVWDGWDTAIMAASQLHLPTCQFLMAATFVVYYSPCLVGGSQIHCRQRYHQASLGPQLLAHMALPSGSLGMQGATLRHQPSHCLTGIQQQALDTFEACRTVMPVLTTALSWQAHEGCPWVRLAKS